MASSQRTVFPAVIDHDTSPKRSGETIYRYLCRSASSKAKWTRRLIQAKYDRFPDPHGQLFGNLRPRPSKDADVTLAAACTSLLMHDYFTRHRGWPSSVDEEDLSAVRRPDLIVSSPRGPFAMELTVVGPEKKQHALNWRARTIEDELNHRVTLPDSYALSISETPLGGQPPYSRLAAQINRLAKSCPLPSDRWRWEKAPPAYRTT